MLFEQGCIDAEHLLQFIGVDVFQIKEAFQCNRRP